MKSLAIRSRHRPYLFLPSLALAGVLTLFAKEPARGAVLALYNFTGSSLASADTDANSSAGSFAPSAGTGTTGNWNITASGVNTAEGNPAPDFAFKPVSATTEADAITNGTYWTFTITPNSGYNINVSNLAFDLTTVYTQRPLSYFLGTNVGGFSTPISGTEATGITTTQTISLNLSGAGLQNQAGAIEFRLYIWSTAGGGSSGSRWSFDNITLNGSVAAVPEPATAVLGLGGIALLAALRKRRRDSISFGRRFGSAGAALL